MGDVIVIAPLLAVLRVRYPDAHIALLTRRQYAGIFTDDDRLSALYMVDRKEMCMEDTLIDRVWDFVVDLQNNNQSVSQIARLHCLDSDSFDKLRCNRTLLLLLRLNRYADSATVAHRYISAAHEVPPAAGGLDFRIPVEGYGSEEIRKKLQFAGFERPVIALFPFSAWKNKEWSDRSFISIGQFFSIKGWRIIIMGGKVDQGRARYMQRMIGRQCLSFAGELSLYECGRMLRHCSLALGCDTGLSHLARACGVKTGFIFGPTTRHFGFQPQGDRQCRIFEHQHFCRPCHAHGGNICWRLNHICMRAVDPEEVIYGMMELFDGRCDTR